MTDCILCLRPIDNKNHGDYCSDECSEDYMKMMRDD